MKKQLAVHLHIYYHEQLDQILRYMQKLGNIEYDLYVTMVEDNQLSKQKVLDFNPNTKIWIVENRGYDVGPFIHVINQINMSDYDYIMKLHTKGNKPSHTRLGRIDLSGDKWRQKLLNILKQWDKCIATLNQNDKIGCVADFDMIINQKNDPDKQIASNAIELAKKLGLYISEMDYCFIGGTMFVIRASILKQIQNKLKLSDFEKTIRTRFSLAHTMERVLGMLVYYSGYTITDIKGLYPNKSLKQIITHKFYKFFYQKKITKSGKTIVKICKIPLPVHLIKGKIA